jgi:hypothetical protein
MPRQLFLLVYKCRYLHSQEYVNLARSCLYLSNHTINVRKVNLITDNQKWRLSSMFRVEWLVQSQIRPATSTNEIGLSKRLYKVQQTRII